MDTRSLVVVFYAALACSAALAQPLGEPDRGQPGDEMIQEYLAQETAKLSAKYADDVKSLADWKEKRPQYVEEYFYMLGLSPRPEKTPLKATVTGKVHGDGYVVENLHYQSRPQLYVTGNLYRPDKVKEGEKLPAIFYVCGHSGRGRNGNKVAFQSHGIWFARHGYVCLIVDTLQLGEIAAKHHGTYNLERWWWHSRGYTPAGVECWNGVRGIDYLVSRPDVDPERIAVTGISGGGAATFWVAAADERVKVAVPVSGMADLESYVPNRVINGHCDCMFLYNTFQWPWTRIAGLVAPRPMLFINSDNDAIFPMDANERVIARLERLYSLYGAGDKVDAVLSVGGHAYRQDIREAEYRFINSYFKGDARSITDSEVDAISEGANPGTPPIPLEKLRVFATDADLPKDELNTTIDEHFVPIAKPELPEKGKYAEWRKKLVDELRRVSFGSLPPEFKRATVLSEDGPKFVTAADPHATYVGKVEAEKGVVFKRTHDSHGFTFAGKMAQTVTFAINEDDGETRPKWTEKHRIVEWNSHPIGSDGETYCQPRGTGDYRWTRKNGPNYVERSLALLGRTADTGRLLDFIATAHPDPKSVDRKRPFEHRSFVAGKGKSSILAAYAAILDEEIAGATLIAPPKSLMDKDAPQFLNALRVCDVPDALGLIAPRPLTIVGAKPEDFARTSAIYEAAGAKGALSFK